MRYKRHLGSCLLWPDHDTMKFKNFAIKRTLQWNLYIDKLPPTHVNVYILLSLLIPKISVGNKELNKTVHEPVTNPPTPTTMLYIALCMPWDTQSIRQPKPITKQLNKPLITPCTVAHLPETFYQSIKRWQLRSSSEAWSDSALQYSKPYRHSEHSSTACIPQANSLQRIYADGTITVLLKQSHQRIDWQQPHHQNQKRIDYNNLCHRNHSKQSHQRMDWQQCHHQNYLINELIYNNLITEAWSDSAPLLKKYCHTSIQSTALYSWQRNVTSSVK